MRNRIRAVHVLSVLISRGGPLLLCWLVLREFHRSLLTLAEGGEQSPYFFMLSSVNNLRSFAVLMAILGVLFGLQQRELRRRLISKLEQPTQAGGTPVNDSPRP